MPEAIYALLGAFIGVLGGFGIELLRARHEDRRKRNEALRSVCADFTAAIARMNHLSYSFVPGGLNRRGHAVAASQSSQNDTKGDPDLKHRLEDIHAEARVQYERLRLLTESLEAQKAGRYALRHAYWVWHERAGDKKLPEAYAKVRPSTQLEECLSKLYIEIRRELGISDPEAVFPEPMD